MAYSIIWLQYWRAFTASRGARSWTRRMIGLISAEVISAIGFAPNLGKRSSSSDSRALRAVSEAQLFALCAYHSSAIALNVPRATAFSARLESFFISAGSSPLDNRSLASCATERAIKSEVSGYAPKPNQLRRPSGLVYLNPQRLLPLASTTRDNPRPSDKVVLGFATSSFLTVSPVASFGIGSGHTIFSIPKTIP